jgi:plasmid stability protein
MGQVLIRNISEGLILTYNVKARLQGTSLEQVLRGVLESNAPFSPAERAALARQYIAEFPAPLPALAKEEIREGLL